MRKITLKKAIVSVGLGLFAITANVSNAQTWSGVGSGVGGYSFSFVSALSTFNSKLYVGGYFSSPGQSIVSWNGSSFSTVGTGTNPGLDQGPTAFATYNSALYISGPFSYIDITTPCGSLVSSNGSTLSPASNTPGGTPFALTVYNAMLCAGGNFTTAGSTKANHIALWNGSVWTALGSGVTGAPSGNNTNIDALCVYNSNLYVGGIFDSAGGTPMANNIAMWNGSAWSTFGHGAVGHYTGTSASVNAFTVYNGNLYVGGVFDSIDGVAAKNIAMWNGTTWSAVGNGLHGIPAGNYASVVSLCVYNGSLYAGGEFDSAGTVKAKNIAAWNGTTWSALGSGTDSSVITMAVYSGALYVGGAFLSAGGNPVSYIAKWTTPAGVEEFADNASVTVYPNPTNGNFMVNIQNVNEKNNLEIYNLMGENVYNQQLTNGQSQVNMGEKPAGIYLYRITNANGEAISTGKLIVR